MAPEKHSPVVDDELKSSPRVEDTDIAPEDDTYIGVRAEIARFLGPSAFPGTKAELLSVAADNDATDDVMRLLRDLPEGPMFVTTQEVVDALPPR
jgi:hypothetical protein